MVRPEPVKPLTIDNLRQIIKAALGDKERGLGRKKIEMQEDALEHLAKLSDGDARRAIAALELGVLSTPPDKKGGITRNLVLKLAKQSALKAVEKIIDPKELYKCDECFITMSGAGIIPITRVWNKKIENGKCGPITQKLILLYQAEVKKR